MFSNTPLIVKTYQLFQKIQPLINNFPKPWRYSLGESLQRSTLAIIETSAQALYARQPLREPLILRIIGSIQSLQLFIRIAFEEDLISEQQFFAFNKLITELSRMAIGWLKATRS